LCGELLPFFPHKKNFGKKLCCKFLLCFLGEKKNHPIFILFLNHHNRLQYERVFKIFYFHIANIAKFD
jgi:hypothetical protein